MSKTTEIICVLDRSGSMGGLAVEVVNSFNEFIADQRKIPGKAKVTVVLFDDKYEVVHDRIKLEDVPELTGEVYFTRGMTALNDAIGKTIQNVDKKRDKVILMIQTDGQENASQEYTKSGTIKKMVEEKEKKGWEVMFLGANIDSFVEGGARGIRSSVNYAPTTDGVKFAYQTMSDATRAYRVGEPTMVGGVDVNAQNASDLVKAINQGEK